MNYYTVYPALQTRFGELHTPVCKTTDAMVISGEGVPEVEGAYARFCTGNTRIADCNRCCGSLIVSPRAAELVDTMRCPPGTSLIPTALQTRDGDHVTDWFSVIFPAILEVVDEAHSQFRDWTGGVPTGVIEAVIAEEAVQAFDLLLAFYVHYVCSEKFKRAVESLELKNLRFERLEVRS